MKAFIVAPEGKKACSSPNCGLWPANLDFFYKDCTKKDGLHQYCKECSSIRRKKYKEDPKAASARINAYQKWKRERKARAYKAWETKRSKINGNG